MQSKAIFLSPGPSSALSRPRAVVCSLLGLVAGNPHLCPQTIGINVLMRFHMHLSVTKLLL